MRPHAPEPVPLVASSEPLAGDDAADEVVGEEETAPMRLYAPEPAPVDAPTRPPPRPPIDEEEAADQNPPPMRDLELAFVKGCFPDVSVPNLESGGALLMQELAKCRDIQGYTVIHHMVRHVNNDLGKSLTD